MVPAGLLAWQLVARRRGESRARPLARLAVRATALVERGPRRNFVHELFVPLAAGQRKRLLRRSYRLLEAARLDSGPSTDPP